MILVSFLCQKEVQMMMTSSDVDKYQILTRQSKYFTALSMLKICSRIYNHLCHMK